MNLVNVTICPDGRDHHDVYHIKCIDQEYNNYRKTSSISRTKSQNLNVSCLLLQWC